MGRREDRLQALALAFSARFIVLTLCFLITIALAAVIGGSMISGWDAPLLAGFLLFAGLTALGVRDILGLSRSAVRSPVDD